MRHVDVEAEAADWLLRPSIPPKLNEFHLQRLGGGTLAEKAMHTGRRKMHPEEYRHHMTSLAYALCYIHHFALRDHVIIHRDIKVIHPGLQHGCTNLIPCHLPSPLLSRTMWGLAPMECSNCLILAFALSFLETIRTWYRWRGIS